MNVLTVTKTDVPYGLLSMTGSSGGAMFACDDRMWKSPSHYVLSTMLKTDRVSSQAVAASENPATEYRAAVDKLAKSRMAEAVRQVIESRLDSSTEFADALAATGTARLVSPDFILEGNIYGIILEQVRSERFRELLSDPIYYVYVAERMLKEALKEGNLQEYVDANFKRMSDLLRALTARYGPDRVFKKAPDRNTVARVHRMRATDYTTNPTSLIKLVRRKTIRSVSNANEARARDAVLKVVASKMEARYPCSGCSAESRRDLVRRDLESMNQRSRIELATRAYNLFTCGKLERDVDRLAREAVDRIYLPTEEEIERYENEAFPLHAACPQQADDAVTAIDKSSVLSPFSRTHAFDFYTMNHAIVYRYLRLCGHDEPQKITSALKKARSFEELAAGVHSWSKQYYDREFERSCAKCMHAFFSDDEYNGHLLLSTVAYDTIDVRDEFYPGLGGCLVRFRNSFYPSAVYVTSPVLDSWRTALRKTFNDISYSLPDVPESRIMNAFFSHDYDTISAFETACEDVLKSAFDNGLEVSTLIFRRRHADNTRLGNYKPVLASADKNALVLALCKTSVAVARCESSDTLRDHHVETALQILTRVRSDVDYRDDASDSGSSTSSTVEPTDYADNEFDEFYEFDEQPFRGSDDVYRYLSSKMNVAPNIEDALYSAAISVNVIDTGIVNFLASIKD